MADQNLNWYTRTYPNFLDDELCDAYVQMFEETLEKDAEEGIAAFLEKRKPNWDH